MQRTRLTEGQKTGQPPVSHSQRLDAPRKASQAERFCVADSSARQRPGCCDAVPRRKTVVTPCQRNALKLCHYNDETNINKKSRHHVAEVADFDAGVKLPVLLNQDIAAVPKLGGAEAAEFPGPVMKTGL